MAFVCVVLVVCRAVRQSTITPGPCVSVCARLLPSLCLAATNRLNQFTTTFQLSEMAVQSP